MVFVKVIQSLVVLTAASAREDTDVMLQVTKIAMTDGPALAQTGSESVQEDAQEEVGRPRRPPPSRCNWSEMKKDKYIGGCSASCKSFMFLPQAQAACNAESTCGGVTLEHGQWELRSGPRLAQTPHGKGENSYVCKPRPVAVQPAVMPGMPGMPTAPNNAVKVVKLPNMCVHALGDKPARFRMPEDMEVSEITYTYKSGGVTCATMASGMTKYGCGENYLGLVITKQDKKAIMPLASQQIPGFQRTMHHHAHWYTIQGISNKSAKLSWKFGRKPMMAEGDYQIWYNEDLTNGTVADNAGVACYDVEIVGVVPRDRKSVV